MVCMGVAIALKAGEQPASEWPADGVLHGHWIYGGVHNCVIQ